MFAPISAWRSLQATTSSISTGSCGHTVASRGRSYFCQGARRDSFVTARALFMWASRCSFSFRRARSSSLSLSSISCSCILISSSSSMCASTLQPQPTQRQLVQSTFKEIPPSWQNILQGHCVHFLRTFPIKSKLRDSSSSSKSRVDVSTQLLSAAAFPSLTSTSLISRSVSLGTSRSIMRRPWPPHGLECNAPGLPMRSVLRHCSS
mmetsp:Transcript_6388/g.15438  ORF Transcript_6388/g.15438 Transcript_6388/m.15438 type:complete len:207 (-) Transcript_6388:486-1106(-)